MTPLIPHVCMTCGDARGVPEGVTPVCIGTGLLMVPFPLPKLAAWMKATK